MSKTLKNTHTHTHMPQNTQTTFKTPHSHVSNPTRLYLVTQSQAYWTPAAL